MGGLASLVARLQIDWETLLTVNLPALIVVLIAVPLVLFLYIMGTELIVRRFPKRAQPTVRPSCW